MPEDQQHPPTNATPPAGGAGQSSGSTPNTSAHSQQNDPTPTIPSANAGGIHFHVRTLKTDLEASASEERTVDLHRVTPPAEKITLPPNLSFDFSGQQPTQLKSPTSRSDSDQTTPSLRDMTMPRVIYPPAGSAGSPQAGSTTPPRPVPLSEPVDLVGPKVSVQPARPEPPLVTIPESEPFAAALDRAIADGAPSAGSGKTPPPALPAIQFEESNARSFSVITNFRFIYLIPLILFMFILGGFGLWRARSTPPAPTVTPPPAQPPEQPLFAPPTGEPTQPLPVPVATPEGTATSGGLVAGTIISTTTSRVIAAVPAQPTPTQLERTPPIATTTEEPKSPRQNEPVLGTQREPQPRLIRPGSTAPTPKPAVTTPLRQAPGKLSPSAIIPTTPTTSPQPGSGQAGQIPTPLLLDLPEVEVTVSALTTAGFQQAWATALAPQRSAGSLAIIHFVFQGQRLPLDFIFRSLATPRFIEAKYVQNFIGALGPGYELVLYYTHTRKFPLFVLDVRDELTVVPFLKLWDKETLLDDAAGFYQGLSRGKFIRKFLVTKTLAGADYRVAYRDDDYKLIWLVYNGRVIMSTTLSGTQILLDKLRLTE